MMKIPKKYTCYFHHLKPGERVTLSDEQTKLYIKSDGELYYVDVDRGVVQNTRDSIKKCDFLCYKEQEKLCHLIELKGAIVQEAPKQIRATIKNIKENGELAFLVTGLRRLDAYIVSPGRQEIPRGIDEIKRQVTRELASHCSGQVENIDSLLKFVKVVSKQKKLSDINGKILCSNEAPIIF